jgi:SAM-dependent methyltransferase
MKSLADEIIAHYQRHAVAWDADRRSAGWNDKRWHDRFLALLPATAAVLDLGCGGGSPVAANLATHGVRLTRIDSSPTLIELCRRRLPDQEWLVADMRELNLARTFDGILAWDSYFHLCPEDQRAMFDVFAAHATIGTILMFNAGPRSGEAIGNYRGDPLYHSSLDPAQYEQLLLRYGFELIDHAIEDPLAGGRTVWLAGKHLEAS